MPGGYIRKAYASRACDWCGSTFTPVQGTQRFCVYECQRKFYRDAKHREAERLRERRGGRRKLNPPTRLTTLTGGLPERPTVCPRCGGLCVQEPIYTHCVLCGRLWTIAGTSCADQRQYEFSGALDSPHGVGVISKTFVPATSMRYYVGGEGEGG